MMEIIQMNNQEQEYYRKIMIEYGIKESVLSEIEKSIYVFVNKFGISPTHILLHPALDHALHMETRDMAYGKVEGFIRYCRGCEIIVTHKCNVGCGVFEVSL